MGRGILAVLKMCAAHNSCLLAGSDAGPIRNCAETQVWEAEGHLRRVRPWKLQKRHVPGCRSADASHWEKPNESCHKLTASGMQTLRYLSAEAASAFAAASWHDGTLAGFPQCATMSSSSPEARSSASRHCAGALRSERRGGRLWQFAARGAPLSACPRCCRRCSSAKRLSTPEPTSVPQNEK